MFKGFFAKKISMVCGLLSFVLMAAGLMSGSRELTGAMGTIFAGSLVAFAISEQNPREE